MPAERRVRQLERECHDLLAALAERTEALRTARARLDEEVSERRRTEEALRAARDSAEAASRAKSAFLANVSHELRTPLNAILGYTEILEEEVRPLAAPALAGDLAKVRLAARHLLELINDLLDVSKIEAGRSELHLESFPLAPLLDEVAATTRPLLAGRDVVLEVVAPDDTGIVHADATKLRQVLLNLVGNAAKFTAKGTIRIAVQGSSREGVPWVTIEVSDTGIGIADDVFARLFVPFSQGDASPTRRFGGTGLGLALSRRYCQMMGGEITVASAPGVGSTFTVELPRLVTGAWVTPPHGLLKRLFPKAE